MKTLAKNIFLLCLASILLIGILETVFRAAGRPKGSFAFALPGRNGAPHEADAYIPMYWGPIAFQVRTNNLGFRGDTHVSDVSANQYRIIILGDSFTYGFFVDNEHTFPSVMQFMLQKTGWDTEVVNMGIPGASIIDEISVYKKLGKHINSDWVILQFYANDIANYDSFSENIEQEDVSSFWNRMVVLLLNKSALLEAALEWSIKHQSDQAMKTSPSEARFDSRRYEIPGQYDYEKMLAEEQNATNREAQLSRGNWDTQTEHFLQQYGKLLSELNGMVKNNKTRMAFLYVPTFFQVYSDLYSDKLQQRLQLLCAQQGIPFLDATPALRLHRQKPVFLMPVDSHLSPIGLTVLAEQTANFYRETLNPQE